jgi:hypothetical protein
MIAATATVLVNKVHSTEILLSTSKTIYGYFPWTVYGVLQTADAPTQSRDVVKGMTASLLRPKQWTAGHRNLRE